MQIEKQGDGIVKTIRKKYLRLNIARKLLLGYLPLIGLTLISAFFALISLENLNKINESIIETDIPLIKATEKMVESVYSQELYGNRYFILKSPPMLELFEDAGKEFIAFHAGIKPLLKQKNIDTNRLTLLHKNYNILFHKWFKNTKDTSSVQRKRNIEIMQTQKTLIALINDISLKAGVDQNEKTLRTSVIGTNAFWFIAALCTLSLLIGISAAMIITRNISKAIFRLKFATEEISRGNFDHIPKIKNQDELGELSHAFLEMGSRLKRMEEMYLDASPLTHLPGSNAIESVLEKRISSGEQIAFCLIDLDFFKAFNDQYGYARGNKLIIHTARIIEEAVIKWGGDENFIGHIGGDDFVVISPVPNYQKICKYIITSFDDSVKDFYDPQDIKKGYIRAKTRQGKNNNFPLMTVSIAVVTNKHKKNMHFVEFGEKTAELKEYAKTIPKSLFVEERRDKKHNPQKKQSKIMKAISLCLMGFLFTFSACNSVFYKTVRIKPVLKKNYHNFSPGEFTREIKRLNKIIKNYQEPQIKLLAHYYLAALLLHRNNPFPDYDGSIKAFTFYLTGEANGEKRDEILNWIKVLSEAIGSKQQLHKKHAAFYRLKRLNKRLVKKVLKNDKQIAQLQKELNKLKSDLKKLDKLYFRIEKKKKEKK